MRNGKRVLAGVAAGALGLALVPFVGATAASADTSAGTVSPVRFTGTTGERAAVPAAYISWPKTAAPTLGTSPTIQLTGMSAGSGKLYIDDSTGEAITANYVALGASTDDTPITTAVMMGSTTDDSFIRVGVDTAGTYAGAIYNGTDTVTFSFTTTGAVASMELTPATQTVLVGGTASFTATVKDSNGNVTQPANIDSIALSQSGAGGTLPSPAALSASDLATGTADFEVTAMASGSTTVTATGAGSLIALPAQTATVTAAGTVSDDTVVDMVVTTPATGVWNSTAETFPKTAQVPAGTSSITITVDDTTANSAGETIRLAAWVSAGTVNGSVATSDAPIYVDVVTDANKQATSSFTLGGGALLNGQTLSVQQVNVANVAKTDIKITVEQIVPAVSESTVTVSPSGSIVRKLGDTTPVTVTVDDSLGSPVASSTVLVYRGSGTAAANLISSGTTDSSGEATVSVVSASGAAAGAVETYTFTIGASVTLTDELSVEYTETGNITTLSVTPSTGSTFDAAGATVTEYPAITVPAAATQGVIDTTASAGVYTISTGATSPAADKSLATFVINPSPANSATVTVPEGVKVSATAPDGTTTIWSSGSQTATISADETAYVWATKTGTHDITIESGGLTATSKLVVSNSSADAYNIGLTPADQSVGSGSINTVTLSVTDVFGNPVTTADDTGDVTITASGEVLLAGFQTSGSYNTGADGTATITVIAGNSAGTGTLAAVPTTGDAAPAWQTDYTPPTGAAAPTTSAAATVQVSGSPTAQAITITGERGTVRGKPGIIVDGVTEGFGEGAIVRPWVKFPGQTSYSLGTKEILVDQDGEFMWQRRTGKKIYIIIKSEDESVRSNRIIIPAK